MRECHFESREPGRQRCSRARNLAKKREAKFSSVNSQPDVRGNVGFPEEGKRYSITCWSLGCSPMNIYQSSIIVVRDSACKDQNGVVEKRLQMSTNENNVLGRDRHLRSQTSLQRTTGELDVEFLCCPVSSYSYVRYCLLTCLSP